MVVHKDLIICLIGYFLAIFFEPIGLIYGAILYFWKKDSSEIYYEQSKIIMGIAAAVIIIKLFASFGGLLFSMI